MTIAEHRVHFEFQYPVNELLFKIRFWILARSIIS
jgi:hypothetical protein